MSISHSSAPPRTEGIKYAGSKLRLIPEILRLAGTVDASTVMDGFSGTTRVSQAFACSGYEVVANDISIWSEVFATCYLMNQKDPTEYAELIEHLNAVQPVDGWFTKYYGGFANNGSAVQSDGLKKPWQIHNTRKLDGIRQEIEDLQLEGIERAVALTSLILGLDKVDSTMGHQVSYLREWSGRSSLDLKLTVPQLIKTVGEHQVFRGDIFDLLPRLSVDLAYFDPPYGSNNEKMPPSRVRYASYYHLWTTICLNDKPPVFGKASRREDSRDKVAASVFEDFRRDSPQRFVAVQAIERMIDAVQARWVILSYSSGGRATAKELDDVLCRNGRLLKVVKLDMKKNVMAGMKWTNEWVRETDERNQEFLFLLEKHHDYDCHLVSKRSNRT